MSTELATRNASGIAELKEWGDFAQKAGVTPQGTTQAQAMAIIQTGREMGLAPMQSLRSMNFIKGRLVMSVQLQLALAKQKGVKVKELKEAEASCTVTLERAGEEITCTYTRDDAKKAGLLRDGGNYEKFPRQMLRWRCIGDVLRLIAPDLVMGLLSPEEAESIEEAKPTGSSAIQAEVVPAPVEAQEAPLEAAPADDLTSFKDALVKRIGEFKNGIEAKNWKAKHQTEIDSLPAADKGEVMNVFFAKTRELNKGAA